VSAKGLASHLCRAEAGHSLPAVPPLGVGPALSAAVPVPGLDPRASFRVCPEWKAQQRILWAVVWKDTRRWKSRWKIRDLLADRRCSQAVLDFLSATDVGRRVPAEEDAGMGGAGAPGAGRREKGGGGGATGIPTHAPFHNIPRRGLGGGGGAALSFCFRSFLLSLMLVRILLLCNFLGAQLIILGQACAEGKRGACSVPPPRGQ